MREITGGCQSGATRYAIGGEPGQVMVCHCTDCKRQSGSAFALVMIAEAGRFRIARGETKRFERLSEAGRRKTGAFCPDCFTRLYHLVEIRPGKVLIRAGTPHDTRGLSPVMHSWTRSKQPWGAIPEGIKTTETQGQGAHANGRGDFSSKNRARGGRRARPAQR